MSSTNDSSRLARFGRVSAEKPDRSGQLAKVVVVLAVAGVVGALTPFGELLLPRSVEAAANSSGPWATIVFAIVYFAGTRGWRAAALAAAAFLAMDVAFYGVFDLLGGYYPHFYLTFWMLIAIVIGPLVGLCASWLREPHPALRAIAVAAPSSVLIGEGVHMMVRLPGDSTLYAMASVLVGAALFLTLGALRLRRIGWLLASAAICAAASGLFVAIYGLLPLVLHKTVP